MAGRVPSGTAKQFKNMKLLAKQLVVDDIHFPATLVRGKAYYVDSNIGSAAGDGLTPGSAYATLQAAIDAADTASADNLGTTIYVLPNHAETITGVGGLTFDVAGLTVIGMGTYNQRPRFLMDGGTTVTAAVTAADVRLENMVFAGGHSDVATCFDIDAVGFTAIGLEFEENTADENFVICFTVGSTTDNTCDGLTIDGCKRYTADTGATHFIDLTGDTDRITVTNNIYIADGATGAQMLVQANGDDMQGLVFEGNRLVTGATAVDLLIENDQTDNTGYAAFNLAGHHDTAAAVLCDCDGIRQFENYSTAADTASGLLLPVADADTL